MYGKENGGADTAVWLAGGKGGPDSTQLGIGLSSIASLTIEVLREVGLLDGIIPTKEGLVTYPMDMNLIGSDARLDDQPAATAGLD